ncbi:exodeoxyribonuclease V subunit beta [Enterovibrio nigricans]|uniref:RecBCD enzyme subunit RecB n=1 Tax=Enterovibrio nigricans DSM 22720 TaxID=1121868 RepID=A0A1T4UCG7_9GAMM|nr:exodeoxyribonuclease V subunit beta [Enterovibrio nigricans]SKA50248.1 DNA helicase/exodeoxyribonuclease V, beta subunit [Enterovibrio nigricans DSM 22720]
MPTQSLQPMTFPLYGLRLIEASAGTGKTFTIAGLYLRLLLGHGSGETAHAVPLSVEKILVVTFTEAATQELRDRIRARIHDARLAFSRGESRDPVIAPLLTEIADHKRAEQLLLQAERQMDEAAIYTIHGFCQRMLTQNAFESGSLFTNEFITDESMLRERAVADFWRSQFYPLPKSLAGVVRSYWSSPKGLLKDVGTYLAGPLVTINAPVMPDDLVQLHQENLAKIDDVKRVWLASVADIEAIITASGVDKRSYSKRTLPNWIAEVSEWANRPTNNYDLPTNLERFSASTLSDKTKKGEVPSHPVFDDIDRLVAHPPGLKEALQAHAIKEVRTLLSREKKRFGWLSFDDLLSQLSDALKNDSTGILAERIRTLYPIAMIDEFQDTDPQQYQIFSDVYGDVKECGLFMIGDPKQAIYAFRGADIFTYIDARRQVEDHYNLGTNWRSTADMVSAVNRIFEHATAPFIYEDDIPFQAVGSAPGADSRYWEIQGHKQPALTFWLADDSDLKSKSDYENEMAEATAISIRDVLNQSETKQANFAKNEEKTAIRAGDIAVLVRTGHEAAKVKRALVKKGIASVYLSNRNCVFSSGLAADVQRLLSAVLSPDSERTLRTALASGLFALTAQEIDTLNQDEKEWERAVIEFSTYQHVWFTRGVLPMLRQVIQRRSIAERLLCEDDGERSLTDLLHLGELLQQASQTLESHHALIRWLADHIDSPNGSSDEQQVRLESERDLVQIVTIHKSKGLEYDLVYLPFVCSVREASEPFFHDENHAPTLELNNPEAAIEAADKERLAEDLRLIYVALTRAVYGCFIGLAPLQDGRKTKDGVTGVHKSALGYLIQRGEVQDGDGLRKDLATLVDGQTSMTVSAPPESTDGKLVANLQSVDDLEAKVFGRYIQRNWRLTSYSGLVKQGHGSALPALPAFDLDAANESDEDAEFEDLPFSSIFQFPRGARPGTFLHTLFENVDFTQDIYSDEVMEMIRHTLAIENYEEDWLPVLQKMMLDVLSQPLNEEGMTLSEIGEQDRLTEMEFVMPVEHLNSSAVNRHIKAHDPLSAQAGDLGFDTAKGMLKGFIDLVFCWEGKYYVLDWKSNYLGGAPSDYTQDALGQAMIEHRYDFQYQIYSLALHRFLRQRIPNYDFERHFGGVYYLFVRGVEANTQHGIFYTKPSLELISGLDTQFENGDSQDGNQ